MGAARKRDARKLDIAPLRDSVGVRQGDRSQHEAVDLHLDRAPGRGGRDAEGEVVRSRVVRIHVVAEPFGRRSLQRVVIGAGRAEEDVDVSVPGSPCRRCRPWCRVLRGRLVEVFRLDPRGQRTQPRVRRLDSRLSHDRPGRRGPHFERHQVVVDEGPFPGREARHRKLELSLPVLLHQVVDRGNSEACLEPKPVLRRRDDVVLDGVALRAVVEVDPRPSTFTAEWK